MTPELAPLPTFTVVPPFANKGPVPSVPERCSAFAASAALVASFKLVHVVSAVLLNEVTCAAVLFNVARTLMVMEPPPAKSMLLALLTVSTRVAVFRVKSLAATVAATPLTLAPLDVTLAMFSVASFFTNVGKTSLTAKS